MGSIGKDFKYKIIKNFLSKEEVDLLSTYCEIKHKTNIDFDLEINDHSRNSFYGDPIMEALLLRKKKLMEQETGKKLLPTYSFWRVYTQFADLKKHKDRASCEISVTIKINSDETEWPIYIDGKPCHLDKGDAAIYLGCELEHWREEFQGDHQFQCFLHYVDADGKNKDYYLDQRQFWGTKKCR